MWGLCEMVLVQTEGQHGRHSDMVYVSNHTREQCGGNWILWQLSAKLCAACVGKILSKACSRKMRLLSFFAGMWEINNTKQKSTIFVLSSLVRGESHL